MAAIKATEKKVRTTEELRKLVQNFAEVISYYQDCCEDAETEEEKEAFLGSLEVHTAAFECVQAELDSHPDNKVFFLRQ